MLALIYGLVHHRVDKVENKQALPYPRSSVQHAHICPRQSIECRDVTISYIQNVYISRPAPSSFPVLKCQLLARLIANNSITLNNCAPKVVNVVAFKIVEACSITSSRSNRRT